MRQLTRRVQKMEATRPSRPKSADELKDAELWRIIIRSATHVEADELAIILERLADGHSAPSDEARFMELVETIEGRKREAASCD